MNNLFFRSVLLLLVSALSFTYGYGQDNSYDDTTATPERKEWYEEDPSATYEEQETTTGQPADPIIRNIPADTIRRIRQLPGFTYMTYLDSLLRAEQKARDRLPPPETAPDPAPSLWNMQVVKFLCWTAAIALIFFILYRFFLGQGAFAINRRQTLPEAEADVNPDEVATDRLLQQAIAREDYRLAVRYLFLITLNRLGEKGVVQQSSEKTNYQYVKELAGKPYADRFARLSLQYEYIWFGHFDINREQFNRVQQQHQQFLKEI